MYTHTHTHTHTHIYIYIKRHIKLRLDKTNISLTWKRLTKRKVTLMVVQEHGWCVSA